MNNKYFPISCIIVTLILFTCYDKKNELKGSWESILIENESSLFAKTLPSSLIGEVRLTFIDGEKFTWFNKTEKLNLSGNYKSSDNRICFNIDGDSTPLEVQFKFQNDKLIIFTEDRFTFTFVKVINKQE